MSIDYSKYEGCTEGLDITRRAVKDGYWIHLAGTKNGYEATAKKKSDATLFADAPLLLAHCKKQDAEVERLQQIKLFIEKVARQKKRNEQDVEDCLIDSDFAEAYDLIIEDARKALEVQS